MISHWPRSTTVTATVRPRGLHGRTLPSNYGRFSRYRFDARYRTRFYLSANSWYYWYAPFGQYLPVEVIATYNPTVIATTPVVPPVVTPSPVMPPAVVPPTANTPVVPPMGGPG